MRRSLLLPTTIVCALFTLVTRSALAQPETSSPPTEKAASADPSRTGNEPLPPPESTPSSNVTAAPKPAEPPPSTKSAADTPPATEKKKDDPPEDRSVYVSFSPLHLFFPVVELTAEVRLHRQLGVAAIGGVGSIKEPLTGTRFTVWEVGGQIVGYPVGHFDHGMQLGVEVMYLGVSGDMRDSSTRVTASGNGLAIGPLIGYKLATKIGFSFNIQGGVQYMAVRADAKSSSGEAASDEQASIIPLLNLNLGWSF